MARAFVRASSQYLQHGAAAVSAYPLTLVAWFNSDDVTADQAILSVAHHEVTSPQGRWAILQVRGTTAGDPVSAATFDGTTFAQALTTSGYSADTWHHGCAVFASETSRTAYIDGGNSASETTSVPFPSVTRTVIGRRLQDPEADFYFSGKIAEAAIWSVALDAGEIAALAKGFCPLLIRPTSLVAYWDIPGNSSPELDRWKSRFDMTVTGATKADHIRIYYPHQVP